jgi:1,4-alpha-glucan branching enzyme
MTHPTGRPGLLRIPGPGLTQFVIRFAPLTQRDQFDPPSWPTYLMNPSAAFPGWWEFDLDALLLSDGDYEYEFVVNGNNVVADPYADTLTRFGGYRGVFSIVGNRRVDRPFSWVNELPAGGMLPENNQIVIYEMPIKWMSSAGLEGALAELGTLDKVIFEHLNDLVKLGINCIELLPLADSPQTLNWGYGTRFFFAPDLDVASAVDAKFFVKACHRLGIRVVLDVVMDMFAIECPLSVLAPSWFRTPATPARQDWSQNLFLYDTVAYPGYYAAREFLCEMAEFWVSDYHIDGYRVDDFADINNWDFVQEFRDRATAKSNALFPGKPFLVVAEDSQGRFVTTANDPGNPNGRVVTDAIWNFRYRDEVRRLLTGGINTNWGEPSRSVRVAHLISKDGTWNDWNHTFDAGYGDMACAVDYITSHDVADGPRLMNIVLGQLLRDANLGDGGISNVLQSVDGFDSASGSVQYAVTSALHRMFGAFAVLLTSVGIPMFLAGEEFGDVHDTSYSDVNSKQQDPVQWQRAQLTNNADLLAQVGKLIALRTSHPALQRDEVELFYFHPQFDNDNSPRVFAYCRSANLPLGSSGQVLVIANMGIDTFPVYQIPNWRWGAALTEIGYPHAAPTYNPMTGALSLALNPFEVRVFRT